MTHDKMTGANVKKSMLCHIVIPFAGCHEKGRRIQTGEEEEVKESRRRRRANGEPAAVAGWDVGGVSAEFLRSFAAGLASNLPPKCLTHRKLQQGGCVYI